MKCLMLAAGYATRLYPLTENYPKPLLKVGGRTIADRLLDDLYAHTGIREAVVVTNHRFARIFEEWAKERRGLAVSVVDDGTSSNETRLGAACDIALAVQKAGIRENLLVMAGDNVLDFSLRSFVDFAENKKAPCVMCHEENDPARQKKTAIITTDAQGLITSYEEKPSNPRGNLAVPPFYCYRPEDLARIPEALADGCSADAPGSFAAWLSKRTPMYAFKMPGKRMDVGTLESYEEVCRIFQKQ